MVPGTFPGSLRWGDGGSEGLTDRWLFAGLAAKVDDQVEGFDRVPAMRVAVEHHAPGGAVGPREHMQGKSVEGLAGRAAVDRVVDFIVGGSAPRMRMVLACLGVVGHLNRVLRDVVGAELSAVRLHTACLHAPVA